MSDRIKFLREAAADMRTAWQCDEGCDPAETEFYCAVADWLDSEAAHHFGPTEHAIAVVRAYRGWAL